VGYVEMWLYIMECWILADTAISLVYTYNNELCNTTEISISSPHSDSDSPSMWHISPIIRDTHKLQQIHQILPHL
jgi:hypothetical protein